MRTGEKFQDDSHLRSRDGWLEATRPNSLPLNLAAGPRAGESYPSRSVAAALLGPLHGAARCPGDHHSDALPLVAASGGVVKESANLILTMPGRRHVCAAHPGPSTAAFVDGHVPVICFDSARVERKLKLLASGKKAIVQWRCLRHLVRAIQSRVESSSEEIQSTRR